MNNGITLTEWQEKTREGTKPYGDYEKVYNIYTEYEKVYSKLKQESLWTKLNRMMNEKIFKKDEVRWVVG